MYYNRCKEELSLQSILHKGDKKMYNIIYNKEVIDTANNTYEAVKLVKEYRVAFKSNNVWYKRGE